MFFCASSLARVPPPAPERHPLALYDDAGIPALAKLVAAVHRYDTKFGIQLWDGGTQAGRRSRGLLLGATYGAAMAVVYGVLGLVVILTAGSFGTIAEQGGFPRIIQYMIRYEF